MPAGSTAVPRPARVTPVTTAALADGRGTATGEASVTGITAASDAVRPGDLFAAVPGRNAHGARFAADALGRGAVAVLTDEAGRQQLPSDVPVVVVPEVRPALAPVAARIYGDPARRLRMLGVTGTSGKTTTTFLLRAGLQASGATVGLIGTVATMIGDETLEAAFTTPEAPELQSLLAVMVERGVDTVAMEVSSHAIAMHRSDAIDFAVGGFTNLSEDHLDFHDGMDDYFATKMRFVTAARQAVVVVDDEWGRRAAREIPGSTTLSTDGGDAAVRAADVRERADGTTSFRLAGPWGTQELGSAIPGRYNVANVALAWTMLETVGVTGPDVAAAISSAQVPGRMERVDAGQPFLAVVDYSHKPAAVAGALAALRPLTKGKLIIVLGCGGDRDRGKRPHMGEIAARDADVLVATDDNPRSEDPAAIRRAMLAGITALPAVERGEVVEIGDRRAAVVEAVRRAEPGDTVLVAGKGHETGQEVSGVVLPFDDRIVLREAIESVR
ncbi:Mur ligase family protein [Jatrophihabitans fulvus]